MQGLWMPLEHNPNDRSAEDVLAALRAEDGSDWTEFRYALHSDDGTYLGDLDSVEYGKVSMNNLAEIKRTAEFRIKDNGDINYLTDRIMPWVRRWIPPYGPNDWIEWPQGLFNLATSRRGVTPAGRAVRPVLGYDLLQVFAETRVTDRYFVAKNANVLQAVRALLNQVTLPLTPVLPIGFMTLPADREWEIGTSFLTIINDLLSVINYRSLVADEYGRIRIGPYVSPADRPSEFTYADDQYGLMLPDHEQELDLFGVPNQWVLAVSNPDQPLLRSVYTNNDPGSLTSTVRRGRVITDPVRFVEAVDQATLDAMTKRAAFEASQIYEAITFSTALMPIHSADDVFRIQYGPLAINDKYSSHTWEMELQAGARMRHRARRVVTV